MSPAPRNDRKTHECLVEAAVLSALRRTIALRASDGVEDAGVGLGALVASLEGDPTMRAVLEDAAGDRRRRDAYPRVGIDASLRQLRVDREAEAHAAAGRLTLTGHLAPDGPDRVVLPGFGAGTWRAIGLLHAGDGRARRWPETVARGPAEDLGAACPAFLRGLSTDPRLEGAAARLHLVQATRQELRNALLQTELAIGAALDAGNSRGVRLLGEENEARIMQLRHLDRELERVWDDGLEMAVRYAAAP